MLRGGPVSEPVEGAESVAESQPLPVTAEPDWQVPRRESGPRPTMSEEGTGVTDGLLSWWEGVRFSPYYRVLQAVVVVVGAIVLWRLVDGVLAAQETRAFLERLLTLGDPFPPIPGPDDAVVTAQPDLRAAARVGAPLVLAVFWFAGGYQIDREARRAFRMDRGSLSGYPKRYVLIAVVCVFPLFVAGVIGASWGAFSLVTWAVRHDAWGSAAALLVLLAVFAVTVRLINALLDRRGFRSGARGPRGY